VKEFKPLKSRVAQWLPAVTLPCMTLRLALTLLTIKESPKIEL
jgi:hypothetical protein